MALGRTPDVLFDWAFFGSVTVAGVGFFLSFDYQASFGFPRFFGSLHNFSPERKKGLE
jgi:hypothetical protein